MFVFDTKLFGMYTIITVQILIFVQIFINHNHKKSMRKFLFLMAAVLFGSLSSIAQDIKILYQGSTLVNGSFVVVNSSPSTSDISQNLWVQNNTSDTLDMKVTKIEVDVVPNTLNATCWEICPDADTAGQYPTLTTPIIRMDPAAIEYSFAAHQYPQGISGCSHFRFIFFGDGTNYRDSVDVYFNHGQTCATPASVFSVNNLKFDIYPNPASENFNIVLDDNITEGEIFITNILGIGVARFNIAELNSKEISVKDLENGIYNVIIRADNKILSSKTIQVQK